MTDTPKTLNEALSYLGQQAMQNQEDFDDLVASTSEENFGSLYHHSLGRWMRNEWGFWKQEGPLYEYFVDLGIEHPDDMSSIIITTFYRRYKGLEEDIPGQVAYYKDYWEQYHCREQNSEGL